MGKSSYKKWLCCLAVFTGLILQFSGCNSGYKKDEGKVSYDGVEINLRGFKVLNEAFAKDSTMAYFRRDSIIGSDPPTFEALDENYAKDKNQVYFCDEYRRGQDYYLTKKRTINILEEADPRSFRILSKGYAKDSSRAYFEGRTFRVKDVAGLRVIDEQFVSDNIQAYFERRAIKGSDGRSFRLLEDCCNHFARDTSHIYFYGFYENDRPAIRAIPCRVASFRLVDGSYSKDDQSAYYEYRRIAGSDAASFVFLNHSYAKDKNGVYVQQVKIEGADPLSFEVMADNANYTDNFYYTRDKNSVYWQEVKVKGADPASFKILGHGYGADKNLVYFMTKVVAGADAKTFKTYDFTVGNADAEDKSGKYNDGVKVPDEE